MGTLTVKKIEMKNDGHDLDRFQALLKKVVNVPKKEIDEKEKEYQAKKNQKRVAKF